MSDVPLPNGGSAALAGSLLFQRLRWRLMRNTVHQLVSRASVRFITILACSVVIWAFIFFLGVGGFAFLRMRIPLTGGIVGTLFDLLFLALAGLLVFSTGLILYSSLFTAPEAGFLLTTPAPADQIFAYKFQGALAFSSWAFVLLGSPILIAYGLV